MAITKISNSSLKNLNKYDSFLAGNAAYEPPVYAFESIATVNGSGSAGNISFTSIPQTYKHLQIRISAMTTSAGASPDISFNGSGSPNYAWHYIRGNGSTASAGGVSAAGYMGGTWANGMTTTNPSVAIIDILDYSNTSKNKTVRNFNGQRTTTNGMTTLASGLWMSTAGITSILFNISGYAFTTTTKFALYGIKG